MSVSLSNVLPQLNALRCFEAAARLLSFKAAANELCITPSAVSHQIRVLERQLGVELFDRHPRAVSLTSAGQTLYDSTSLAFNLIKNTSGEISKHGKTTILKVLCPHVFFNFMLKPLIDSFHDEYPQIHVQINHLPDILFPQIPNEWQDHDAAILIGNGYWGNMNSYCMLAMHLAIFAVPSILRHPAPIEELSLIAEYPWLSNREFPSGWSRFLGAAGQPHIKPLAGEVVCDNASDVFSATIAGKGLSLLDITIAKTDLFKDKLVQFSRQLLPVLGYYLAIPEAKAKHPPLILLRDFLMDQARTLHWPQQTSSERPLPQQMNSSHL